MDIHELAEEKRASPRMACQFMVRGRILKRATWDAFPLKDISRGGARLVCEGLVDPGEELELWLGLPLLETPAPFMAHVVWQHPMVWGQFHLSEMGVRFARPGPEAQQVLEAGLQRVLKFERQETRREDATRSQPTPEETS